MRTLEEHPEPIPLVSDNDDLPSFKYYNGHVLIRQSLKQLLQLHTP